MALPSLSPLSCFSPAPSPSPFCACHAGYVPSLTCVLRRDRLTNLLKTTQELFFSSEVYHFHLSAFSWIAFTLISAYQLLIFFVTHNFNHKMFIVIPPWDMLISWMQYFSAIKPLPTAVWFNAWASHSYVAWDVLFCIQDSSIVWEHS